MNTKLVSVTLVLLIAILAVSIAVLVFTVQLNNSRTGSDNLNLYSDTIVVNTITGQVRGLKAVTLFESKSYYSFKGIPYAKPPLGDLRFKVSV